MKRWNKYFPLPLIIIVFLFNFQKSFAFKCEVLKIINLDEKKQPLNFPTGIKIDSDHLNFYILDSAKGKLILYDFNFIPYFSIGKGRGLYAPSAFTVDRKGYFYIAQDSYYDKPARITILNPIGLKEKEIIFKGPFLNPNMHITSIEVDDKYIYVVGNGVKGALIFEKNTGKLIKHLNIRDIVEDVPQEVSLRDVYIDKKGRIYFLSEEAGRFYVYDKDWHFLFKGGVKGGSWGQLSRPRGIAASSRLGVIVVMDYLRHTGLVYDYTNGKFLGEFGGEGWLPGWFQGPTDVDIDFYGRIYIVDSFNRRIQVLVITAGKTEGYWTPSFKTPLQPVK